MTATEAGCCHPWRHQAGSRSAKGGGGAASPIRESGREEREFLGSGRGPIRFAKERCEGAGNGRVVGCRVARGGRRRDRAQGMLRPWCGAEGQ